MKYGYARTSTDDQKPDAQTTALRKAGCVKVFEGRGVSGSARNRPALARRLDVGTTGLKPDLRDHIVELARRPHPVKQCGREATIRRNRLARGELVRFSVPRS